MPRRHRRRTGALLENRLHLHRFICREFGFADLDEALGRLRNVAAAFSESRESEYARALYRSQPQARMPPQRMAEYDANLMTLSRRLRMTGEHGRTWKPHQYLALLFTEHYLRRYFDDADALCDALNRSRTENRLHATLPDYALDDLRTLAFQSATGSGKTLLMHAHVLQYRHYLARAGQRLNNVVLITPNEQMSLQHQRELQASGLEARLFASETRSELFAPIEIIDLNKLATATGVKRVAVKDFGDDNLVLVDEGHLGASGKVWRARRRELAQGGFTFEYSATFNQVASRDEDLLHAYGKSLLFNYSYPQFHKDGYGKDYAILNLPGGDLDANSDMYLLGCLLTFYQQCCLWQAKGAQWRAFNLAKPLWVFLGKTVTGTGQADQATRSDVIRIVQFLGWALAQSPSVQAMLQQLLSGNSGLVDGEGRDYFSDRFPYLPLRDVASLYVDLCHVLFHGPGRLRVTYLAAGEGELHLRTADNAPFGVVNVGDSAKLYNLLSQMARPEFDLEREMGFRARLFADVDRPDSPVNLVIGARRFIAGWNSWRVSTMGLMHVGVGEGPEIIQMFGRGIRLQGWNLSLKRHSACDAPLPEASEQLAELEKLYIFGLRANYMQTFQDLLQREGMRTEQEKLPLPVTWNFAQQTDLKLIRIREDRKYDLSSERPVLPAPAARAIPVISLDLYSQLHFMESESPAFRASIGKSAVSLKPYAGFFDSIRIYDRILLRKRQKGWWNLLIDLGTVEKLLRDDTWYELLLPPERLKIAGQAQMRQLEDVAVDLIAAYADSFWRGQRRRWEHDALEVVTLKPDDPNVVGYELSVNATEERLIEDARELKQQLTAGGNLKYWYDRLKIGVVQDKGQAHAYQPLLWARPDREVLVQPVPLDANEKRIVEELTALAQSNAAWLANREIFLIRNLTRGRGVSFFDDFGYYPDFIVWIKERRLQHVLFLDPKGLRRLGLRETQKVRLHRDIKIVEDKIRRMDENLLLHAYILSVTSVTLIEEGRRTADEWKREGVYFLNEPDCLAQVIRHALGASAPRIRA